MTLYVPPAPTILPAAAAEGTHDCYLSYVSTTQLRLDRFGGNRLMCNGVREVIPAAGVSFAGPTVASYMGHLWCGPNGGVAGAPLYFGYDASVPVIDAYGMPVHPTYPYLTLVGRALTDASGNFQMTAVTIGVASYWNRRLRMIGAANNQTTGSTSIVELHGGNRLTAVGFSGDPVVCLVQGQCTNNAQAYTYSRLDIVSNPGESSALGQMYAVVATAWGPIALQFDTTIPASGYITSGLSGYVNAGVGSWYPYCTLLCLG